MSNYDFEAARIEFIRQWRKDAGIDLATLDAVDAAAEEAWQEQERQIRTERARQEVEAGTDKVSKYLKSKYGRPQTE